MPERTQILFQSVIPRVGCYLTRLTSQTMSEPFMKNFTGQNSESDGIHPITCRIMSEQTQILFHRVIPRVGCYLTRLTPQTISEPFILVKIQNWIVYTRFTCWIMSEQTQLLFHSAIPRVGCYLIQLTPHTVSDPFIINFELPKFGIGLYTLDIHLIYIVNNVRMDPNIIFVDRTPSRILFNPTVTPKHVRTIRKIFRGPESPRICCSHVRKDCIR